MEITICWAINVRVKLYVTQDTDIDYLKAKATREMSACSMWTIICADFENVELHQAIYFQNMIQIENVSYKFFHVNISNSYFGTKSKLWYSRI